MTAQQGRQRTTTKHNLSGCHVEHQGLFHPGNKPYLSSLPPPPHLTNLIGARLDLVLLQGGRFSGFFFLHYFSFYINKMSFFRLSED